MTTPHQSAPDGAYIVGGSRFGQDITVEGLKDIVMGPAVEPTVDGALDAVAQHLQTIPLETLEQFRDRIPGITPGVTDSPQDVVDAIMNSLGITPFLEMIDAWVKGLQGQTAASPYNFPSINDIFNVGFDKNKEMSNISAALAQLKADFTANNNSGKSFQVNVIDSGVLFPTEFTKYIDSGTGAVTNDGDTLEYLGGDGLELFLYNPEPLVTDYFEVSLIIPRATRDFFGSSFNNRLFIIGRSNADMTSFCFVQLGYQTARFGCVRDGISTITSPEFFGPPVALTADGYVTFRGGVAGDANFFQLLINNQIRAAEDDSSNISLIGDDYRWVGFGVEGEDANGILVGNISHFTANDNKPATIVGSGATMTRTSTGMVTAAGGFNEMPTSFYDNIEVASSDITVDITNGTFEVTEDAWYEIKSAVSRGSDWPDLCELVLYKNASPLRYSGQDAGRVANAAFTSLLIPRGAAGAWSEYLVAGDVISMGYDNAVFSVSNSFTGEATGAKTYFTITRGKK